MTVPEKLRALRACMKEEGIDAWLVPTDDFHGSEYVGDYFKCREFITGFTGSAGYAVIMEKKAALWTDGRYFLQAENQLQDSGIDLMRIGEPEVPKLTEWLSFELPEQGTLGFDGRTVSRRLYEKLERALPGRRFAMDEDLIGLIWEDRPKRSAEPVFELEKQYAGKTRAEKIDEIRRELKKKQADCTVIASLDDIAWLLNLRGGDVAYNPVALSYLILKETEAVLYIAESAVPAAVRTGLEQDGILLKSYESFYEDLPARIKGCKVCYDPARCSARLVQLLEGAEKQLAAENLTELPKALKNSVEVENIRKAHKKDGVAVTRFLYWLKHQIGHEAITECSAAEKLDTFRQQGENYRGQSFDPIAGYAEHGAIIHYSATEETDKALQPENFLLLDTGGQYLEGTTDITRTIPLGPLNKEQKRHYTAVLRGNLNLAAARFKEGILGLNLDCLARLPLWEAGYDYNHGTGHGVGYFLNVHEGPQNISHRLPERVSEHAGLREGMVLSDEPGLYLPGKYGIRLENMMVVQKDRKTEFGQFLRFETLTLVPFDPDAVEPEQFSEEELHLFRQYQRRVYREIGPLLPEEERAWLDELTRAI